MAEVAPVMIFFGMGLLQWVSNRLGFKSWLGRGRGLLRSWLGFKSAPVMIFFYWHGFVFVFVFVFVLEVEGA